MNLFRREASEDIARWASANGYSPVASAVIAGRFSCVEDAERSLRPKLKSLTPPERLPDVDQACQALIENIESGGITIFAVDYDNDGCSSAAVLYRAITEVFGVERETVSIRSGNRFTEGYGLSAGLTDRLLGEFSDKRCLVLTADMGSSDEERISRLKEHGIPVIVTDHHAIPAEGIPKSAIAVVNPTRDDSGYDDPLIAGCGVAWLVMARLFTLWRERSPERPCFSGEQKTASKRRLLELLSYTASGTVGDCVSLSRSHNNRLMVQYGLQVMRQSDDPCWVAFRGLLDDGEPLDSSHISFKLAPMCNSPGRLTRADAAVSFLTTQSHQEALSLLDDLIVENNERKRIESEMREAAVKLAREQYDANRTCAVIFLEDGHPGVQGICASRVVEQFGRPACIFSPRGDGSDTITASLRSVKGIHIRDALEYAFAQLPENVARHFGGHEGAAGASIPREYFKIFAAALDLACEKQAALSQAPLAPVIVYDGEIPLREVSMNLIDELISLGPYGREFEQPCFQTTGVVHQWRTMGAEDNHLRLTLCDPETGVTITAVQFFIDRIDGFIMPTINDTITLVAELSANWFRSSVSPQLIVRAIQQVDQTERAVCNG